MATIFRKNLCPIDFSKNSIAALDEAAKLARKDKATVYLMMHVEFVAMNKPAELAGYDITLSTEPTRFRLEQIAREHLAKVRHEIVLQVGWPGELIQKAARDCDTDLIVMATHGRTGMARVFLGSIAEHIIRTSERSVLSLGPGTAVGVLKKILCPVDFDPNSISALKFGWRLAQRYKATVSLLHVVALPFEPSEVPVEAPVPEWKQNSLAELEEVATENLGANARCKLVVRRGDPALAILEMEKELKPDLVVMATHGRTGLSHLVLGSVAERTVRESTVPVLTVRGRPSLA